MVCLLCVGSNLALIDVRHEDAVAFLRDLLSVGFDAIGQPPPLLCEARRPQHLSEIVQTRCRAQHQFARSRMTMTAGAPFGPPMRPGTEPPIVVGVSAARAVLRRAAATMRCFRSSISVGALMNSVVTHGSPCRPTNHARGDAKTQVRGIFASPTVHPILRRKHTYRICGSVGESSPRLVPPPSRARQSWCERTIHPMRCSIECESGQRVPLRPVACLSLRWTYLSLQARRLRPRSNAWASLCTPTRHKICATRTPSSMTSA